MTATETTFVAIYLVLILFLSVVALHRLHLAIVAWRHRRRPVTEEPSVWPSVLVQLPLYNERFVAARVIDYACRLDYPRDKLTIQVLDDSTDSTSALVAASVNEWRRAGVAIEHVRRNNRASYKAGALAHGLGLSSAQLVAVFDADFLPPRDMLRRLVPEFRDAKVGMVQARWGHANREESILTQAEAIMLDAHFANEHGGRFARGCFFNFNGTAGIWRRAAIDDAGGWSGDTLTEDLELSYRAQLRGWRFVYREDVEVKGELPADVKAFKCQQHRWAKGSIQTTMVLGKRILASGLPWRIRFEALFHIAANFAYPVVLLLIVLMPWVNMVALQAPLWVALVINVAFFLVSTTSIGVFYVLAERRVGADKRSLRYLPMVLALGIAMAVNNTRAVLGALFSRPSEFNRTPKLDGRQIAAIDDPGYVVRADWQAILELLLGSYLLGGALLALASGSVVGVPFLSLFAFGFLYLSVGSLWGVNWRAPEAGAFASSDMPTAPC